SGLLAGDRRRLRGAAGDGARGGRARRAPAPRGVEPRPPRALGSGAPRRLRRDAGRRRAPYGRLTLRRSIIRAVTSSIPSGRGPAAVHPHLPRFSQGVTGVLCLEAAVFGDRWAVAVAAALVAVALLAPRWSPVGWIFRQVARPAEDLEPAAPVRFAQWMALTLLVLAFVLLVAGAETAGWAIVGLVSAVALFSAITGFCV